MLDSERTFKVKARSAWTVFKILLTSAVICIKGCWPTFDIQISITLAMFWGKLQTCTIQKAYRSLSKHANIRINRGSHYEKTAL